MTTTIAETLYARMLGLALLDAYLAWEREHECICKEEVIYLIQSFIEKVHYPAGMDWRV